ncbi:MAG: hypothetical protein J1E42_04380, partial [Akkermansiaceae bacterium]|nr:hypothetical protein [Akkermansiaceae bacterium]
MNNNIVSRDILMQGGQLSNASKYNGTITITSAEGFTGNIQLGGASAATIQQLQTGAGVTVGGMTGALTIHEGDFMYVGAGSIGVVDGDGAGAPMLSFSESGSISFGNNSITLYFDEDAFDDMVRDDSGKASFEIYFTDGKLGANDIGKFEFGEEYSDFVITGIQDGKLMVNGTLPEITPAGIWFASEHVDDKSGLLTESGKMPGLKYSQVVVNRNAHLTISKATQLNELQGDSLLDLLGGGDVTLNIESEETLYSGTISTVAGVSLEKVGEGILEVSGKLDAAGAVKVSEGWLYLSGEAHNIGSLSMNDGYLQLGDKTQLNLTGASTQSGGTITGGSIVLDGSSAGYEMTGGSISGTSISLSDGATFTQKDGQVSSTTITIDGAGSVYKLGWLSESIEDNHTSSLAGNKEIKITNGGKFVQDGHSSIFTSNDSAVSITIDGEGSEYVMESTNGGGANMGAWGGSVEIEIKNGGKFTQGDSNCWVAHAISSPEKNSTIKISGEGSEYEMKDGRLGGGIGIGSVEIGISEGGKFTQKDGDIDGKETSITITGEKKSATFEQSGGTLTAGGGISVSGAQASFVQSGGKITGTDITLSKGASFTQSKGSIESSGKITLNDSGSFTQSGGSVGKGVSIELNDSSSLTLASGGSMAADVVLKGAKSSYDLGHQAASGSSITMNGGSLKNAGSYKGSVSIDIKSGYKGGDIKLGGVDASTITSVKIKEGGVSLSELKAGTTLTLTGSDNLLTVGSGNTDLDGTSGTALIQFVDGDGYICFNKDGSITLVLDLTGAILKNLESQENFTIHLSNGKITDWTEENFVFSGLLEELGFYVEKVENGDLIVRSGELGDNLFRASEVDGRLDDVDKQESLKDKDAVVMDEDLTIEVGEGFDDDELTLNNVVTWVDDESKTDLDITNKSGEDLDVNLHNDFNTTLDGNLTAKSEGEDNQTNLKKTGEGNLTVTGNVRTDGDLDVQEGGLGVGGDADIGGGVTVGDSENDTEGKLVVEGDL